MLSGVTVLLSTEIGVRVLLSREWCNSTVQYKKWCMLSVHYREQTLKLCSIQRVVGLYSSVQLQRMAEEHCSVNLEEEARTGITLVVLSSKLW